MNDLDPLAAWCANPFFVLELKTDATRADIERAGQRLLAKFTVSPDGVAMYQTPLGPAVRDADMVRQSLAALRDPVQRITHELWANIGSMEALRFQTSSARKWEDAERTIGWAK